MVFDRTVVSAHVSAGFINDAIIRPTDDQQAAWVLEFVRVGGYNDCMTHARKSRVKTYKTCDAALADASRRGE